MDQSTADGALKLLRLVTGDLAAQFRPGQLEAITALVEDRKRVLVVRRTGWGKSAVYFIATRLLRDQGAGASLLISPLLALMRNQIEMAARAGVRAATINSANRDDWDAIEQAVQAGEVDLLLISPERLNNFRFLADVLPHLAQRVGLLIVDEAHCISDWGHDFRPDYRRVARVLGLLPSGVPVLGTTATANERVIDDVVSQLGDQLHVFRGSLDRESLRLSVVVLPNPAERLAWLSREIAKYHDHRVPEELLNAALSLMLTWAPDPAPTWLTWVPSSSSSALVEDFAERLSAALHLPSVGLIARVRPSEPQKTMENSAQQLTNVYGAFAVSATPPDGPCLLLDDVVDSRWTLTVVGVALRQAGSGPVYPFVLAQAMS